MTGAHVGLDPAAMAYRRDAGGRSIANDPAFGDARTKRGGSRGRARVPAAVAASRMGFVPWLFVYANPKAKPPPRHALASALWLRTRMFPTVIVEGGGVVPAVRTAAERSSSVDRARARRGLAGGAANVHTKKARGPSGSSGRAGFRNDPGELGSVVRKIAGDGAPRPPRSARVRKEAEGAGGGGEGVLCRGFRGCGAARVRGCGGERDATGGATGDGGREESRATRVVHSSPGGSATAVSRFPERRDGRS